MTCSTNSTKLSGSRAVPNRAIVWLTKLFNHIFWSNRMSDEWRSTLVPIYKNNGEFEVLQYQGIKLMRDTMKHRLREITRISMN
jgi:hypothetical protein